MYFYGQINNKKIDVWDKQRWRDLIAKLDGHQIEIKINKHKDSRTAKQNRFYHGILLPMIAEHYGYDNQEEVCVGLRMMFLKIPGKLQTCKSTADLSVEEMADYLDKTIIWAGEQGFNLPDMEMIKTFLE